MEKDHNPFLNAEWLQIQQDYLKALTDLYPGTKTTQQDAGVQGIWKKALDNWSSSVSGLYSDDNRSIIDALLKQSQIFNSITENFALLLNDMAALGESRDDWQQLMQDHFESMKAMFDEYTHSVENKAVPPGFMWTAPMDAWNQVMARMAILPTEIMDKIQKDGIDELSRKFLSLPSLGLNQNLNEKLQNTLAHWYDYQKYSTRYREVFIKLGKQALDKLQEKILDKAAKQEKITSLREIYNMWIDANEDIFAEHVFEEDYSSLYADLVNSLIEFRKHSNILSDEMLAVLNIPTSAGVKSLTERQHRIKNELKETARMQQRTLDTLEEFRKELKKLSGTNSSKTTNKKITKKTTPGKKKANKKTSTTRSKSAKKTGKTGKTGKARTAKKS